MGGYQWSSISMSYATTSEEDQAIIRANLQNVIGSPREVRDPDSQFRRKQIEERQLKEEIELRKKAYKLYLEQEELRPNSDKQKQLQYEGLSGGRYKLLEGKPRGHVLFTQVPQNCPYCETAKVVYPLSGWNQNRDVMGYSDCSIAYDADEKFRNDQLNRTQRHQCVPSGEVLSKQIQSLSDELKKFREFVEYRYQPRAMM